MKLSSGFVISALFVGGCGVKTVPTGMAGLPNAGKVRISGVKISENANEVSWEWSIIGDRNWSQLSVRNNVIQFSKSYPLNSVSRKDGTHLWIVSVTARETGTGSRRSGKLELNIRGSNATQFSAVIPIGLTESTLVGSIKTVMIGDNKFGIDGDKRLLAIGRTNLGIQLYK